MPGGRAGAGGSWEKPGVPGGIGFLPGISLGARLQEM